MKKSTVIVTVVAVLILVAGLLFVGYWIGKPSAPTQVTDATKVKLEMPVGDWGVIFGAIERNVGKMAIMHMDTTKPAGSRPVDSIAMALNTIRKGLTDQNPILKQAK